MEQHFPTNGSCLYFSGTTVSFCNGIGYIVGTTSLVHAIGVNKATKRTQTRMSGILNGCALWKFIELMCLSLALGIYIASIFKLMRVKYFALSIIELWIFQLLNFANGNGSDLAPDASTLRLRHATLVSVRFRRDRRFRSSFVTRYRIRSCNIYLVTPWLHSPINLPCNASVVCLIGAGFNSRL